MSDTYCHTNTSDFIVGERVELISGWVWDETYGEVIRVGPSLVYVLMDKSHHDRACMPHWLRHVSPLCHLLNKAERGEL